MSLLPVVAAVVIGLLIGIFGGLKVGELIRGRARTFWIANGVALLLGMIIDFIGLATGNLWLALGAVGLMGGALTGLKYGYSESIGIWRTIDTWTGTDAHLHPDDDDEFDDAEYSPDDHAEDEPRA